MILFNGYTQVGPVRWWNPDVPGKEADCPCWKTATYCPACQAAAESCEHGHHPADCLLCFKASEDAAKGRFGAVALTRAFSRPVAW